MFNNTGSLRAARKVRGRPKNSGSMTPNQGILETRWLWEAIKCLSHLCADDGSLKIFFTERRNCIREVKMKREPRPTFNETMLIFVKQTFTERIIMQLRPDYFSQSFAHHGSVTDGSIAFWALVGTYSSQWNEQGGFPLGLCCIA